MLNTSPQTEVVTDTSSSRRPSKKYPIKKILLAVVLAFVTVGIFITTVALIFPQIPIIITVKMKFPESKYPSAYNKLIYREIKPLKLTKDTEKLKYCGVEFKSPGATFIKDAKPPTESKVEGCVASLQFSNDVKVAIVTTSIDYVGEFQGDNPGDAEKIEAVFGEELLKSNYKFLKEVLDTNIDEVTILSPRNEVVSTSILFILKTIYVSGFHSESGIYNFELPNVKGFQFGKPKVSENVGLLFYNERSNTEITLIIVGLTQEQIDFIINSIKIN